MFQNLCEQYFRHYDSNGNGLLECAELLALALDLGDFMLVHLGVYDEAHIRASISGFSTRGDAALTPEEFQRWFASLVDPTAAPPQAEASPLLTYGDWSDRRSSPVGTSERQEAQAAPEAASADGLEERSSDLALTPGYLKALAASPNLLLNLCRQYFHRYDVNHNGIMEASEVLALARGMSKNVAVPLAVADEDLLRSVSSYAADGRSCLSLDEFCDWFPVVLGLQSAAPGGTMHATPG